MGTSLTTPRPPDQIGALGQIARNTACYATRVRPENEVTVNVASSYHPASGCRGCNNSCQRPPEPRNTISLSAQATRAGQPGESGRKTAHSSKLQAAAA